MPSNRKTRIIVALDYADERSALEFADVVTPDLCKLKIGKSLFTRAGPLLVKRLVGSGFDVFLDLKFHDIPATVADAVGAAADLGAWMVNVHCAGGSRMLQAARRSLDARSTNTLLTGVTVLTSMAREDLLEVGIDKTPDDQVMLLAGLAAASGLDGVVCSGHEAGYIKQLYGNDFIRVTPGIRPAGYMLDSDDQRRTLSPAGAISQGASHLVIGRPVTGAKNPRAALLDIKKEIGEDI